MSVTVLFKDDGDPNLNLLDKLEIDFIKEYNTITPNGYNILPGGQKRSNLKKDVDPFYLTYSKCMSILYGINSLSAVKILWKFLEEAQYNTGKVVISPAMKKQILSDLDISESIYTKSLKLLQKLEIVSGSRGEYQINEQIF